VNAKPWATSTRRLRLPPNWPQIRLAVLARDGYVCHVCRQPGANQVDHVLAGDDHRETNLAAIHAWPCHASKSSREGAAAKPKRLRPPERHPGLL
jgi:5-methylcytosine-specific restriction protein A